MAGFPEGHPSTPNRLQEMDYFKQKVDAGADYVCTCSCSSTTRDFYDFRERCELAGVRVPILAGIMPITSRKGMVTMAGMALGARFPAALLRAVGPAACARRRRRGPASASTGPPGAVPRFTR